MFSKTLLSILFFFASSLPTMASVVMQGNRVIYDASVSQKSIKFTNNDTFPYIVQVWVSDSEDKTSTARENTPFAVSPAIFKIIANQDQVINLLNTSAHKELEKEQIYYLHFTQVPSIIANERDKNKLVLIVNSVVKIFLRPADAVIPHDKMFDYINYTTSHNGSNCELLIHNNSPYYINSIQLTTTMRSASKNTALDMIAPLSTYSLRTSCINAGTKPEFSISYINDYGVVQQQILKEK